MRVNEDGEETIVEVAVDTFALSVFGLLMCQGSLSQKVNYLYEIMMSVEKVKDELDLVYWRISRLYKAFTLLFFYAEILPKKYQSEFLQDVQDAVTASAKTSGKGMKDEEQYLE